MTFGVFVHKVRAICDDVPEVHYQFPKSYLSRAEKLVGDLTVCREPQLCSPVISSPLNRWLGF